MLSQVIKEFGKPLETLEAPTPTPTGSEVLVRITNCGVCHSDLHIHEGHFDFGGGNKLQLSTMAMPHTLGHEIAGEVISAGPDAKGVKIGGHFSVFPWIGCGECAACKRDEEVFCLKPRNLGCNSGVPGGYATHVLVPHPRYLIDYGNANPALAAAYMCSGVTAYSALKKVVTPLKADQEVIILGVGGVGMMGVTIAKALFGKAPIAADISEERLEAAKKAGAKATYNTKEPGAAKQILKELGGAHAIIDFVGSEATFAFANGAIRKGGRIIIVGLFGGAMTIPIPTLPMRGVSIMGSFVSSLAEAQELMALVRAGKIDPIPVETRPLDAANRTLDDLRAGKITGRVVLTP